MPEPCNVPRMTYILHLAMSRGWLKLEQDYVNDRHVAGDDADCWTSESAMSGDALHVVACGRSDGAVNMYLYRIRL